MRRLWILVIAAIVLAGCAREASSPAEGGANMRLGFHWQRLVTGEGETCDRCGSTEQELREAIETLKQSLRPLGIEIELVEEALTPQECAEDIIGSNRIVIGGRTVEEWLGGEAGQSPCESCCTAIGEDVECRTVVVDGTTYETVPAELVVRAGLLAASDMMQASSSGERCSGSCGPGDTDAQCCPGAKSDEGVTE